MAATSADPEQRIEAAEKDVDTRVVADRPARDLWPVVRRRPPRPARLRRRWPDTVGWLALIAFGVSGIVAVGVIAGAEEKERPQTTFPVWRGLRATLQEPAVAFVVAIMLLLVVAWGFRRLWLLLLAWRPGPVRVHDIVLAAGADECDVRTLTAHLRQRLGNLRIRSPAPAPGATAERSFIDALVEARLDSRNPLGSLIGILRATKPDYGYEVRATLTRRQQPPRYGVGIEAVRLPHEGVTTGTYWGRTPEEAVEVAGDAVAAGILPHTRRCGPPWSGWRRFRMQPDLLHAYERAAEFTEARRYDEALTMYFEALARDPMNLDVRLHIGFVQEKMGLFIDAMAMYASARDVGLAHQRGMYDVLARLHRRASCRVARYRLCALLAGRNLAAQWRRHDDSPGAGPERTHQRERLRCQLTPLIHRLATRHDLVGPVSRRDKHDRQSRWTAEDIEGLLKGRADPAVDEEHDEPCLGYYRLRWFFVTLALRELSSLRWSVWLRPARGKARLDRRALKVGRKLVKPREIFIASKVLEEEKKQPESVDLAAVVLHDVKRLERLAALRTWTQHYNAACILALPLLIDGARSTEFVRPMTAEKRAQLAEAAVRQLGRAAASVDSAVLATRRDWLVSEDPDLDALRRHDAFKRFEVTYLPSAAPSLPRPPRVHQWEMAAYAERLIGTTAERWEHEWRRRAFAFRGRPDAQLVLRWFDDEVVTWDRVRTVAENRRHWPSRAALIARMAECGEKHDLAPLSIGVPRFGTDLTPMLSLWPGADDLEATVVKVVDDEIEARNRRIERFLSALDAGACTRAVALHLLKDMRGLRTELRACNFHGPSLDPTTVIRLCNAHAGLWQRLREWFGEPLADSDGGHEAAFDDAIERVCREWAEASKRWRASRAM